MDKKLLIKIGFLILILVIIRLLVIYTHNYINLNVTDYIDLEDNVITAEDVVDSSAKTLLLEKNQDNIYTFYVESSDKNVGTFIYEDGQSEYSIYVDDNLRRQNYNEILFGYTDEIAYGVFDIEKDDYKLVDGRYVAKVQLQTQTEKNTGPVFLLGTKDVIRKTLTIRTTYNTIMMICFFIIFIISSFFYYRDRASYMFITLLISIVSMFKCIVSGELPVLSNIFDVTIYNYFFYDGLTNVLNYFLYQSLLYKLYQFKIKKIYIVLYVGLSLILTGDYLLRGNVYSFLIVYFIGVLIIILLQVIGYIKNKPYSMILLTTYSVFAGFNFYRMLIASNYLQQGYISSVIYGPQIGSIIYVFGFLFAVIMTYFNNLDQYKKNQEEYERVILFRGISHDLKLPLAVIKLNNQMLEKYDMTGEEKKKYVKTSIEAIHELEKMTDNINSYLNMEMSVSGDYTTSIKESFNKLKNHYNIFEDKNYKFTVVCDDKDYLLPIKSLQFERMLYNLVDNAFKYNKAKGEVKVGFKIDNKVTIIVEDSGIGMDQNEVDKIFTPFYRIDHSRNKDGLGLGLSVVKGIIDSLDGDVKVESKKGIGTKIIITFPKKKNHYII